MIFNNLISFLLIPIKQNQLSNSSIYFIKLKI